MSDTIDRPMDGAVFRHLLGHYPTGVCVITANALHNECAAMVVGSFTSVSLDPPLVAFFPDKASTSWPKIERAGNFCVNILSSDQQHLCRRFSAKAGDKFEGLVHGRSENGSPVFDGVLAWIDCRLYAVHEAGDHYAVMARVQAFEIVRPDRPMLFFRGQYGEFTVPL